MKQSLAALRDTDALGGADSKYENLFSHVPVFVSAVDMAQIKRVVQAVEAAAKLLGYYNAVLSYAPDVAHYDPGPAGVFMGYDFHLNGDGPQLIEVNTNAGGAFLVDLQVRTWSACCAPAQDTVSLPQVHDFENNVMQMFRAEWARQRGQGGPSRIAIIDDDPRGQFMYPEFLLAQRAFERHGVEALILAPEFLVYKNRRLFAGDKPIDLVYNRLVDFALALPSHAALRAAYLDGSVVVTPNPHVHALLANKRNLTFLSDPDTLRGWGLDEDHTAALRSAVPRTTLVMAENADALWEKRRNLFFKPATGHGSKAVYRGSKLTKGVWAEIVNGDYVAQSFTAPEQRIIEIDGCGIRLKADLRLYTYTGKVLFAAARLYQGQATNFRTRGGGFAPVFGI
nr:hypothetical protein [Pseudomonas sp. K-62]